MTATRRIVRITETLESTAPVLVRVPERILTLSFVPPRDPFNIADPCPFNATGHQTITSCGSVVCCHCSKIF